MKGPFASLYGTFLFSLVLFFLLSVLFFFWIHQLLGFHDFILSYLACSAGGMALSTLVPATVSSISSLAKSAISSLKIWSLHGLLLTIEAAGLSYVSHVQVFNSWTIVVPETKGSVLISFITFYSQ